ncbi:MAG: aspartate--tRNA(Asn) ligase [Candidatus Thermoplasmatota archaeon]|nr:aspartate--tRNA(Asn) ligase [Candidatus Thermoplasmatota archaeon]MBU1941992.1 aspartate--tRNA(Asn) ligase [Candidatus Thermoplasmatota archaeon]
MRSHYSIDISEKEYNTQVTVAGWIEDIRNIGAIAFIIIRDNKGTLQVTALKKHNEQLLQQLTALPRESVISVSGMVKENAKVRNGYEIIPESVEVLSIAETPLPLGVVDKVEADFDTRLDNRFIDLRKREQLAIFKIRSEVIGAVHDYLRERGFLEVHTPNIIPSCSEGGTDVFKIRYFEKEAYLAQSPQLYKQSLMATGFDHVYEIAWYFRAEEHNTRRHLNESTAVDLEMAFISSEEEVMQILEGLVNAMWLRAGTCDTELAVLNRTISVPKLPFPRITYDDVLTKLAKRDVQVTWGADLGIEEERVLGDIMKEEGVDFYFITRYPLESKPFYTMPEGEKLSRGFDLECMGVELASGSQRIHHVDLLMKRMKTLGLDPKDFDFYLKAFRYGMPPHGGFGFGIERFLMRLLDIPNIRECILFPRDRTRLSP